MGPHFKKVSVKSELNEILDDMEKHHIELAIKLDSFYEKTNVKKLQGQHLITQLPWKEAYFQVPNWVVTFKHTEDRYVFQAKASKSGDGTVSLQIIDGIYRFERRQNFRVRVPLGAIAEFESDCGLKFKCPIFNISTGGVGIEVDKEILTKGNKVKGVLTFNKMDTIKFSGQVRRIQRIPMGKSSSIFVMGIMFENINPAFENTVFTTVVKLHREFTKSEV